MLKSNKKAGSIFPDIVSRLARGYRTHFGEPGADESVDRREAELSRVQRRLVLVHEGRLQLGAVELPVKVLDEALDARRAQLDGEQPHEGGGGALLLLAVSLSDATALRLGFLHLPLFVFVGIVPLLLNDLNQVGEVALQLRDVDLGVVAEEKVGPTWHDLRIGEKLIWKHDLTRE